MDMPYRLFQRARNSNNNIKEDDVILSFGLLSLQQRTQKKKKEKMILFSPSDGGYRLPKKGGEMGERKGACHFPVVPYDSDNDIDDAVQKAKYIRRRSRSRCRRRSRFPI